MQEQFSAFHHASCLYGTTVSILTGTGLDRFLGMGNDTTLGLGLSPGGCITANANLVRDLTSFQPPSQYPSQCITPSSYHHLDPQGALTCHARKPARPKDGFFWGCQHSAACCTYLQHHISYSDYTDKTPQMGLYIRNKRPLASCKSIRDKQQRFGFDLNAQLKPVWSKRSTIKLVLGLPKTYTSFP
jgi:hypothetical protein